MPTAMLRSRISGSSAKRSSVRISPVHMGRPSTKARPTRPIPAGTKSPVAPYSRARPPRAMALSRPSAPKKPDRRAVDTQEAEHAVRDALARGGDVELLADQAGDPGQLLALVPLPREGGLEARVLEHERHLLREARQQGHLRLGEAPAGRGGQDEASGRHAGGQHRDGRQGAQATARDRLAAGGSSARWRSASTSGVQRARRSRRARSPKAISAAAPPGAPGRVILGGGRHPGHRGRIGLEPPGEAGATGAEEPDRRHRDALGGPDNVNRAIQRRPHASRVQRPSHSAGRGVRSGIAVRRRTARSRTRSR